MGMSAAQATGFIIIYLFRIDSHYMYDYFLSKYKMLLHFKNNSMLLSCLQSCTIFKTQSKNVKTTFLTVSLDFSLPKTICRRFVCYLT